MTVSWQPLNNVAFDSIASYTSSVSTLKDSSYKVLSGTFISAGVFRLVA